MDCSDPLQLSSDPMRDPLTHVLTFLSLDDLVRLSRCCRTFYYLAHWEIWQLEDSVYTAETTLHGNQKQYEQHNSACIAALLLAADRMEPRALLWKAFNYCSPMFGVPLISPQEGEYCFREAARRGNIIALSQCYAYGIGYPVDHSAAFALASLQHRREPTDLQAVTVLAMYHATGLGCPADMKTARKLFREASLEGYYFALDQWSKIVLAKKQGDLWSLDVCEAGVERGSVGCLLRLCMIHLDQRPPKPHVPVNPREGVRLLQTYRVEHPSCMYLLAQCYENGNGVEKDVNQAIYWYERVVSVPWADAWKESVDALARLRSLSVSVCGD